MKTIIERGASWTLEETKLLLSLWGQDLVQRQATNQKRTKEVYEKISEKFIQSGYERTADQVRTRVFNMIAEYRRILKDPMPERVRKCLFFDALHKIYQAKHMDDVKSALDDYEPDYPYSPPDITSNFDRHGDVSDNEAVDSNDALVNNQSANNSSSVQNSNNNNSSTTNKDANCATSDNNGDSISSDSNDNNAANNTTEKESSSSSSSCKRVKLESPKSGAGLALNSSEQHASSKQNKTTSSSTQAGTSASASQATATTSNTPKSQQSLLLPHATSASASTPITKLTTSAGGTTPSYININSTKLPIIRTNQLIGHSNGNESNSTPARLPTTAAITSHQLYQAPVNTFDVTSSALLIDRMFAHLSRESENMREWIALEKERLALERVRRTQETEREVRRERVLIDTLIKFQEQWISFLTRINPGLMENSTESPPEIRFPTEASSAETSSQNTTTQGSGAGANTSTVSASTSSANANNTSTISTSSGAAKQ